MSTAASELVVPAFIRQELTPEQAIILSPEALAFVAALVAEFRPRVQEALERRIARQQALEAGQMLDFLPETAAIREGDWKVGPLPADLQDRRVEITGPIDRKMIINALNSGATMFMADLEDSNSPTWHNVIDAQVNLRDAVRDAIDFTAPESGRRYTLSSKPATLMVRPRGFHLWEKHITLNGEPIPGGLFDFGLYLFHNAKALLAKGSGPYFYLPKMESHLEARMWNEVFVRAQALLGLPTGTIKATCLIETINAAFEMDEILYELREHSAGLNCGRWDYIFSFIKRLGRRPEFLLPDRSQITMEQPFMLAYTSLAIKTCHRRGVHCMGGMAAQIPIKNDAAANELALAKVRADKLREVKAGHDGTWVAHPGLVAVAKEIFDAHMPTPNQLHVKREDVHVSAADLLRVPQGTRTEAGLRHNSRVAVQYLEAWLRGIGCVPIDNLMEDAATAEISRSQVWQWLKHSATLKDASGKEAPLTIARFRTVLTEEVARLEDEVGKDRFARGRYREAAQLFDKLSTAEGFEDFLTLPAYEVIRTQG